MVQYGAILNLILKPMKELHFFNDKIVRQEAHGPHRSPEKPVQIKKHIIQSYDYIISSLL